MSTYKPIFSIIDTPFPQLRDVLSPSRRRLAHDAVVDTLSGLAGPTVVGDPLKALLDRATNQNRTINETPELQVFGQVLQPHDYIRAVISSAANKYAGAYASQLNMAERAFQQCMSYPTPHIELRSYDTAVVWARQHGMDLTIDKTRYGTKVGHHVDNDGYGMASFLQEGYDMPIMDPLFRVTVQRDTGIWPLGIVPAVSYMRASTYHSGYIQRGGEADSHNRWMREKDWFDLYQTYQSDDFFQGYFRGIRRRGFETGALKSASDSTIDAFNSVYGPHLTRVDRDGFRSTFWYGYDEVGKVVSACNSRDLFLDWSDFRGWIDNTRE